MSVLTVDIFDYFISSITTEIEVYKISDDGTDTTFLVSSTFYVKPKMPIDVDGVEYIVKAVNYNSSITVTGVIASAEKITLRNPSFYHGTPLMTNKQLKRSDIKVVTPLFYLAEIMSETEQDEDSSLLRTADVRLFFLDTADTGDWNTEDHYSNRLLGLNSYIDAFIGVMRQSVFFYTFDTTFTRINHTSYGEFSANRGNTRTVFDENLCGVELTFTAQLRDCDWGFVERYVIRNRENLVLNLNDLGDVVLTNPQANDTLVFNGTNWINVTT